MQLRRRSRDDDGATAVEAAIVSLLLFTILFGIIEMSLLMRDAVASSSAVRAGSRVAAASAAAGPCDKSEIKCTPNAAPLLGQAAADAVARATAGQNWSSGDWVMVYEAGTNGYPTGKTGWTCDSKCVKYVPSASEPGKLIWTSGTWDTTATVNACVNDNRRHAVGVALSTKHGFITGLFGSGITMVEHSVMYFEPLPNETCLPGAHG